MLDHGQLGPAIPVVDQLGSDLGKLSMSRRGSSGGSFSDTKVRPLGLDGLASFGRGMSESLSMSAPEMEADHEIERKKPNPPDVNGFAYPSSLSAQLHANPKLAALRTAGLPTGTTPLTLAPAPQILADPRCSGYFVETVCPYDHTSCYSPV